MTSEIRIRIESPLLVRGTNVGQASRLYSTNKEAMFTSRWYSCTLEQDEAQQNALENDCALIAEGPANPVFGGVLRRCARLNNVGVRDSTLES